MFDIRYSPLIGAEVEGVLTRKSDNFKSGLDKLGGGGSSRENLVPGSIGYLIL